MFVATIDPAMSRQWRVDRWQELRASTPEASTMLMINYDGNPNPTFG